MEDRERQPGDELKRLMLVKLSDLVSDHEEGGSEEELAPQFQFLDELRESGVTNMFGATPYLQEAFGIDSKEAKRILAEWMKTFSERHPKKEHWPW